ncbi:hypothetical protein [Nocardiopsis nanhaiensis]
MNQLIHRTVPDTVIEAVGHARGILEVVLDHHPLTTEHRRTITYVHNDLTGPHRYEETTLAGVAQALAEVADSAELGDSTLAALDSARGRLPLAPTPDTRVAMSAAELPTRLPLLCRLADHHGALVVILVFNADLTPAERVEALHHTEELPADLVGQITAEITRRPAEAVNR